MDFNFSILKAFLLFAIVCVSVSPSFSEATSSTSTSDLTWDELIFTQEWGYSACLQFKDKFGPSSEKKCRYEGKPSIWSVHGIWPTKEGSMGPNFCTKVKFDINLLTPILPDLNKFWYEIDADKDAHRFWEHEWVKHGSCAMQLDVFGTELKYFGEGVALRNKLDLYSILKEGGGIVPSPTEKYQLEDIHKAFQKALGSESSVPYVQCLRTKNEASNAMEFHILAVEICMDKDLRILDCRHKKRSEELMAENYGGGDQALPCPSDHPILYTDYAFQRDSKITKRVHRFKPFVTKSFPFPLSKKSWKRLERFRYSFN